MQDHTTHPSLEETPLVKKKHGPRPRNLADAFWSRVTPGEKDDCWEWQGRARVNGYGIISHGRHKKLKAHRVSYELHTGKSPGDLRVLHHCDNRICVNPYHLFLGTDADNVHDKINKGRQPRGETHGQHKLTEADVVEIRRLFQAHVTMYRLAQQFGVTRASIKNIIRHKTWNQVP